MVATSNPGQTFGSSNAAAAASGSAMSAAGTFRTSLGHTSRHARVVSPIVISGTETVPTA